MLNKDIPHNNYLKFIGICKYYIYLNIIYKTLNVIFSSFYFFT